MAKHFIEVTEVLHVSFLSKRVLNFIEAYCKASWPKDDSESTAIVVTHLLIIRAQ